MAPWSTPRNPDRTAGEASLDHPLLDRPSTRPSRVASVEPSHWVGLVCTSCEVAWRGDPVEPCWSCGSVGRRPAGTTVVRD
ncbi:MAG: hypothetical protein P8K65_09480 [Acidimicrobiales bacterium]|nr:hypothetical protein [Acidimicrobiales bacterium]